MDWNDVRHFLALARTGSVRAAGAALGVSHSTVARRVEALEEQLSTRLFDRSRDGYQLTLAGQQMLPAAERIEHEMVTIERGIVGQDERLAGPVAITCCDAWISNLLLRELRPFCAEHPDIELVLTTDSRPFDLAKREADVAVRALGIDDQPQGFLLGRKLAPVSLATYVGRAHAERLDPVATPDDMRWVSFDNPQLHDMLIARSSFPKLPRWGSFSSLSLIVQGARWGYGIVMLPTYVGDAEADLQRLGDTDPIHMGDLWLLCHPDLRDNARIRATRAAIHRIFEQHQHQF